MVLGPPRASSAGLEFFFTQRDAGTRARRAVPLLATLMFLSSHADGPFSGAPAHRLRRVLRVHARAPSYSARMLGIALGAFGARSSSGRDWGTTSLLPGGLLHVGAARWLLARPEHGLRQRTRAYTWLKTDRSAASFLDGSLPVPFLPVLPELREHQQCGIARWRWAPWILIGVIARRRLSHRASRSSSRARFGIMVGPTWSFPIAPGASDSSGIASSRSRSLAGSGLRASRRGVRRRPKRRCLYNRLPACGRLGWRWCTGGRGQDRDRMVRSDRRLA